MTSDATEKSELRRRFRQARAQRFSQWKSNQFQDVPTFLHLLDAPEIAGASVVTSYISINDEPSTTALNLKLIVSGKILLLPRVVKPDLEWVPWNGDRARLQENRGLLEPLGEPITELSIIDAVIVPALQIDKAGYRIGQGGGYYDRALPHMPGWKVGLIYEEEFSPELLPREEHDIPLVAVATSREILRIK